MLNYAELMMGAGIGLLVGALFCAIAGRLALLQARRHEEINKVAHRADMVRLLDNIRADQGELRYWRTFMERQIDLPLKPGAPTHRQIINDLRERMKR